MTALCRLQCRVVISSAPWLYPDFLITSGVAYKRNVSYRGNTMQISLIYCTSLNFVFSHPHLSLSVTMFKILLLSIFVWADISLSFVWLFRFLSDQWLMFGAIFVEVQFHHHFPDDAWPHNVVHPFLVDLLIILASGIKSKCGTGPIWYYCGGGFRWLSLGSCLPILNSCACLTT